MSKKRGIYRLFDTNTKSYISVIGGVIRYDKKITYNSAFVYDLQDALLIKQTISRTYKKYQNKEDIPDYCKKFTIPVLVPVNISEVLISNSEREFAIRSAPYLGISKEQALVNAKWQKIRKYKHYFHFGQSY
ncbi:hypothetical protein CP356_08245 [Lactobacillus sp. UMNPBX5]|nr:hypothetical protein CP356_08245 [Lactobacillus sp. UMNPBX5]